MNDTPPPAPEAVELAAMLETIEKCLRNPVTTIVTSQMLKRLVEVARSYLELRDFSGAELQRIEGSALPLDPLKPVTLSQKTFMSLLMTARSQAAPTLAAVAEEEVVEALSMAVRRHLWSIAGVRQMPPGEIHGVIRTALRAAGITLVRGIKGGEGE